MSIASEIVDSFAALYFQPKSIKDGIVQAMEEYALACLEKAAENAKVKKEIDEEGPIWESAVVDKASITSKDNLV